MRKKHQRESKPQKQKKREPSVLLCALSLPALNDSRTDPTPRIEIKKAAVSISSFVRDAVTSSDKMREENKSPPETLKSHRSQKGTKTKPFSRAPPAACSTRLKDAKIHTYALAIANPLFTLLSMHLPKNIRLPRCYSFCLHHVFELSPKSVKEKKKDP